MHVTWTSYPSLFKPAQNAPRHETWVDFCTSLKHQVVAKKDNAPCLGPYALPHGAARNNANVSALTLAVFDVDHGVTPESLTECRIALAIDDLVCAWYSSFSHAPSEGVLRYRLIIPLARPIPALAWKPFRERLLRTYAIPADPLTSSDYSHVYYLPSCPPERLSEATVWVQGNKFLDPGMTASWVSPALRVPADFDYEADDGDLADGETLAHYRSLIERRAKKLRGGDPRKARYLERCIEGVALSEPGDRDEAATRTAMMLVYALPDDATCTSICALMAASIQAMIDEGSARISWATVRRKIHTALEKKARARAAQQALIHSFDGWKDRYRSG